MPHEAACKRTWDRADTLVGDNTPRLALTKPKRQQQDSSATALNEEATTSGCTSLVNAAAFTMRKAELLRA
jgi:hypothetical protein